MVLRSPATVWALSGLLGLCTLAMLPAIASRDHAVRWAVVAALVVAVAVAETLTVSFELRREAHSLGVNEIVLGAGLVAAGGRELILGQFLGVVLALIARRQPPVKLVYNVAQYTLTVAVSVLSYMLLDPSPSLGSARTAAAVLGAILLGSTVSFFALMAVVLLVDAAPPKGETLVVLVLGYVGALANACLGLSVVSLAETSIVAFLCLLPAVGLSVGAYRAYLVTRQRRDHLRFLLDATRTLHVDDDIELGWSVVLTDLRRHLAADSVTLYVAPRATQQDWLKLVSSDAALPTFTEVGELELADLLPAADRGAVHDEHSGLGDVAWLRRRGWRSAILADIHDDERLLGHFLVGPRSGSSHHRFAPPEVTLVEALANQVGGVLETGRLEHALHEITELKERLQHEALHDSLTGLANRSLFSEALEVGLAGTDDVSVMLIDLDDFKAVNDDLGHAAGDRLLCELAERLLAVVRDGDTAARLGGDEFAVVLPHCSREDVVDVGARLLDALAQPILLGNTRLRIHASIGTATRSTHALDEKELLRRADLALYEVKRNGKGGQRSWSPIMRHFTEGRNQLGATLPMAVADGEFLCHYQPVIDLTSERPVAVEALVRWQHPERGLLLPETFLSMAEDSGWMHEIGEHVLRTACMDFSAVRRRIGVPAMKLHVNVSPVQVDGSLPHVIAVALHEAGLHGGDLVLEVTETQQLASNRAAIEVMEAVRELGVHWALDDFGTGYAALDQLADLPVSVVKLPRQLVTGMRSPRGTRLVSGTLALARAIGLTVVAEGVEHSEQAQLLREGGCDAAQGYLWSRALSRSALNAWLDKDGLTAR